MGLYLVGSPEVPLRHFPKPKQDYWADYKEWLKRLKDGMKPTCKDSLQVQDKEMI